MAQWAELFVWGGIGKIYQKKKLHGHHCPASEAWRGKSKMITINWGCIKVWDCSLAQRNENHLGLLLQSQIATQHCHGFFLGFSFSFSKLMPFYQMLVILPQFLCWFFKCGNKVLHKMSTPIFYQPGFLMYSFYWIPMLWFLFLNFCVLHLQVCMRVGASNVQLVEKN